MSTTLGPFALSLERLFFLIAFGVALLVGWLAGRRARVAVEPVLTQMLLLGMLSARIAFVLLYLGDYLKRPLSILNIGDGGFVYEVGLAVAAAIGVFHAWRRQPLRAPLGAALAAGLVTWGFTVGAVRVMHSSQPPLPAVQLRSVQGNSQSLTDFSGQPMVVNLWATWCPPCRREMPVLAAAQRQKVDVAFIFVNQGQSAEAVQSYLESEQLQLNNVLLDPDSQLSHRLGIQGMPTTLFFDASGNLVETHMGELSRATLRRGLEQF